MPSSFISSFFFHGHGFLCFLPAFFKNQLIEYAQKSGLPSPVYNIIKEGPEHERRYKATVVIDNETYESPTYYLNLKKAEHGAAEVALAAIAAKSGKISAVPNPLVISLSIL